MGFGPLPSNGLTPEIPSLDIPTSHSLLTAFKASSGITFIRWGEIVHDLANALLKLPEFAAASIDLPGFQDQVGYPLTLTRVRVSHSPPGPHKDYSKTKPKKTCHRKPFAAATRGKRQSPLPPDAHLDQMPAPRILQTVCMSDQQDPTNSTQSFRPEVRPKAQHRRADRDTSEPHKTGPTNTTPPRPSDRKDETHRPRPPSPDHEAQRHETKSTKTCKHPVVSCKQDLRPRHIVVVVVVQGSRPVETPCQAPPGKVHKKR